MVSIHIVTGCSKRTTYASLLSAALAAILPVFSTLKKISNKILNAPDSRHKKWVSAGRAKKCQSANQAPRLQAPSAGRSPDRTVPRESGQPTKGTLKTTSLSGILCITGALALAITALAQTAPVLKIAPSGTNQYSVTITNAIGTADYDLLWIPVLANTNYLWTYAAIGVPGGTNFILDANPYPATFFRAILDTNTPPLWEQSDPQNPPSPLLKVTILNPANGANLTQ